MSLLKVNEVTDLGGDVPTGVGKIFQVLQTVKTDTFTTSSTSSFVDVPGLSVSITPTSATSKILVSAYINLSNTVAGSSNAAGFRVIRDSTAIFLGDAFEGRLRASGGFSETADTQQMFSYSPMFLDSPSTTSSVTYKIDLVAVTGTAVVNRTGDDANSGARFRVPSTITVMEVAG